jgi:hypothetical protein
VTEPVANRLRQKLVNVFNRFAGAGLQPAPSRFMLDGCFAGAGLQPAPSRFMLDGFAGAGLQPFDLRRNLATFFLGVVVHPLFVQTGSLSP